MGEIKIMSNNLACKIAAGEVVERVSNVVKELVENSIDAESKNIKIELFDSGTKEIKITDDGKGMDEEDAVLAFSSHATSKIKNENDLFFISTLGFRGEALASIASVSIVDLYTSKKDIGTHVKIKGGIIELTEKYSPRKGTIISVKNLFYNTPVRLKFLKSLNTELINCVKFLEKIALSHSDILFSLYNNDNEIFKTSASNELHKTIHEIYGFNISKNMVSVFNESEDFIINGYVSNININKTSKNFITTIVNGRIVQNTDINKIIKDSYHTFLAEDKYPVVILNIETDPTLIDVNIHPTKQDIKFSKIDDLKDQIFNMIRTKLNEISNMVNITIPKENEDYLIENKIVEKDNNYEEMVFNFNTEEESFTTYAEDKKSLYSPVGLALGTYLIAQCEDIMYVIDIHAANERINYEIYLEALKNEKISATDLIVPITIELSKNEYLIIKENMELLDSLSFKVEEFGINTFKIITHPTWLKEGYEEESIRKIFELICVFNEKFDRVKFNERLAINLSCKMSVKANTSISFEEQETLINRLFKCEFPYTCPHGRPTIIKYPKYELEKIFKRVD